MTAFYKWITGILWIAIFSTVVFFCFFVFRFAYNFPYYDDLENIVEFTYRFTHLNGFRDKALLLFEQNFEHRVVYARLLTLLQYWTTGQLNITWLIVLGNLSLAGLFGLFGRYHFSGKLSLPGLFAIACLLFQAQHYEDSVSWATCSLQHAPCILFSLLSFHIALRRKSLFLSGGLALLAVFTSANGLSAMIIWLMIAVFKTADRRKLLVPALLVIAAAGIHLATLTVHSGSLTSHMTTDIGPKVLIFLSFAGQIADPRLLGSVVPSVLLGLLILFPLVWIIFLLMRRKADQITELQWLCGAGLLTLSFVGFLITFARGAEADFVGYQMDRYKIYAALFAVIAAAFYDHSLGKSGMVIHIFRSIVAACALVFCISSYYLYYENFTGYRSTIEANRFNYLWSQRIYYPLIYFDAKTKDYLPAASKSFLSESFRHAQEVTKEITAQNESDSLSTHIEENSGVVILSNSVWELPRSRNGADVYVMAADAASGQPLYLFTAETGYQKAVKQFVTTFTKARGKGFTSRIFKQKVKPGKYQMYLLLLKNGRPAGRSRIGLVEIH